MTFLSLSLGIKLNSTWLLFQGNSNSSMAAFRETYFQLHEFRSLAPSVKVIALTATATSSTKKTIINVLRMESTHTIFENPSKPNVAYSVYYIPKERMLDDYFQWLANGLLMQRTSATRTIIYCRTIKQCSLSWRVLGTAQREFVNWRS